MFGFEFLFVVVMFFIRYQIEYCEILCKKIGAKNVHQSPMELMKTIARLHFDIFEYVTSFIWSNIQLLCFKNSCIFVVDLLVHILKSHRLLF